MEKQADDDYAAKDSKTRPTSSSSDQVEELELASYVAPTEEEMDTLRHVPDKINWSAYCTFSFDFLGRRR